ncbi:MAG: S-layer homology domain-containing protein [Ruminococcaceae bacterium]|nr:S-layer homology domain-containing protein [Oscillospiraceae bacterium]
MIWEVNTMKKRVGLVAGLFALSLVTQAFALDCTIDYDTATNKIALKGTAKAPVLVTVVPDGAGSAGIAAGNAVATAQYDWHNVTKFDESIPMDKNLPSGMYDVLVSSNEQYIVSGTEMTVVNKEEVPVRLYGTLHDDVKEITTEIYHINIDDGFQLVADLNTVKTDADALYDMIETGKTGNESTPAENRVPYTELLGVDPDEFAQYGEYVAEQLVGTKDGVDFVSTGEVVSLVNEYRVLYEAINSTDPSAIVSANAAVYDADVERFVTALDSASSAKLNTLLKNFNADGRSLSDELPELSALAVVQAADRWQTIETVVTDTYADVLEIDFDVDNRTKVFKQMMHYDYNTFADIESNFDKADGEVNGKKTQSTARPSGNGGGGGGGGIGSFEIAPSRPEQREEAVDTKTFTDVPADFWGKDAISQLAAKNVISGYPDGTFRPEGNVTRAEFVKMLTTAFGLATAAEIPFADVTTSDWYYNYIRTAYASGIISGGTDGTFNPNGEITREDACVIVYRYLSGIGVLDATKASFADEGEFASYAADAIATLAGNGIVNGVGNNRFDGKASINRASCAVLILNCLNK